MMNAGKLQEEMRGISPLQKEVGGQE